MHFSHLVKVRKNSHSLSLQAFLTHSHSLSLSLAGLVKSKRCVEDKCNVGNVTLQSMIISAVNLKYFKVKSSSIIKEHLKLFEA